MKQQSLASDVDQTDLPVLRPSQHREGGELRTVVRAHRLWPTTLADQPLQHPRYAATAEAGVASSARHSRVYASTTLRMRTILPVAKPSTLKSIAHS